MLVIIPEISLEPPEAPALSNVKITGSWFHPKKDVTVRFENTDVLSTSTDELGKISGSFKIPDVPAGQKTITVTSEDVTITGTFQVMLTLKITSTTGSTDTTITVTGSGAPPNEKIIVSFGATSAIASTIADEHGNFTVQFLADAQPFGSTTISALGISGVEGDGSFQMQPTLELKPPQGHVGTQVEILGYGFKASSEVAIQFGTIAPAKDVGDFLGSFIYSFRVEKFPYLSQGYEIKATDEDGNSASGKFSLYPSIEVQPAVLIVGQVGQKVLITGKGFAAQEELIATMEVNEKLQDFQLGTTYPNGLFSGELSLDTQEVGTKEIIVWGQASVGAKNSSQSTFQNARNELKPRCTVDIYDIIVSENTEGTPQTVGDIIRITVEAPLDIAESGSFSIGSTIEGQLFNDDGDGEANDTKWVGEYTVKAGDEVRALPVRVTLRDKLGNESVAESATKITITTPVNITIEPSTGSKDTEITVEGINFGANEQVTIDFGTAVAIATATTDANGSFSVTFPITAAQPNGAVTIKAAGVTSGQQAENKTFMYSGPQVTSVSVAGSPAKTGETITVTLEGETEGVAKFSIEGVITDSPMVENPPGVYTGEYVAEEGINVIDAIVTVTLTDSAANSLTDSTQKVTIVPEIDDIFPTSASIEGGTEVTITGKGFASGATVTIGGKEATDIQVRKQGTEIVAKAPGISIRELLDDSELRDVTITNSDGQSDTLEKIFQYYLLYTFPIARGWNLISFPGDVIDLTPDGFFGTDITDILNANHETPDTFELGEGYWVLAIQDTNREVKLLPKERYTRSMKRVWNLIGSVYGKAPIPTDVIELYSWNAKQEQYEEATLIEPSKGYWALANQDSEITVVVEPPRENTAPAFTPDAAPLFHLPLRVDFPNRPQARLVIAIHPDAKSVFDRKFDIALPPPAPDGELPNVALLLDGDLPLRLSKKVLPVPQTGAAEFLLQVANNKGDTVLSWNATQIPDDWSLSLIDQTSQIDMAQLSTYLLPKGKRDIVFLLKQKTKQQLPKSTALLQNYPNPFNPETWIPYQLADSAQVSLTIYDVRGHIVRQLFLGQKAAGFYVDRGKAAYWDGRNDAGEPVSSGIYFYSIKAGDFKAVRKLAIAK